MQNILIRRLEKKDIDKIAAIYSAITGQQLGGDFQSLISRLAGKDSNIICDVAEADDKIIGFMVSYILTLGFGIEKSAWIATLGVDPDHMGKGVGEKLGQKMIQRCREMGINELRTSVRWDSTDLLSFFKTLGFNRSDFINLRKEI